MFRIYRMQASPSAIVIMALGLCGSEDSTYAVDLIEQLPKTILIITVRGLETCEGGANHKFFVKNDFTRILLACQLARQICPVSPIIGLGISLGGALLIQAHASHRSLFRGIIVVSTSLWYEDAVSTMSATWKGWISNLNGM